MSTVFGLYCNTHEEIGPQIRRGAGGTGLYYPEDWHEWLLDHEFCDQLLVREQPPPAHRRTGLG